MLTSCLGDMEAMSWPLLAAPLTSFPAHRSIPFLVLTGWPRAMPCHVMVPRAMPYFGMPCHAIFWRVMACHEYSMPCRVRIFWGKWILKKCQKYMPILCQEYMLFFCLPLSIQPRLNTQQQGRAPPVWRPPHARPCCCVLRRLSLG